MKLTEADEVFVDGEIQALVDLLFQSPEMVMTVLRFHLWSEQKLEQFLHKQIPRSDRYFDRSNPRYNDKLSLADSFDIIPDAVIQCLRKINTLRNDCAHRNNTVIDHARIEDIGRPLGSSINELKKLAKNDQDLLIRTLTKIGARLLAHVHKYEF